MNLSRAIELYWEVEEKQNRGFKRLRSWAFGLRPLVFTDHGFGRALTNTTCTVDSIARSVAGGGGRGTSSADLEAQSST